MRCLYDSGRISKTACVATLPDGELVVGHGKEGLYDFPMDDIGKYPDMWAGWKKEAEDYNTAFNLKHNRSRTYLDFKSLLDFKQSKTVGVYKANLKIQSVRKGWTANDKIFWIDADTGAHYSMDVADMYEMVNGFAQGIVTADPNTGIVTAEVFPNTRGDTTFLSVFTKEMKAAIELVNDTAAKRKSEKLKPKQFVVGHVYSTSLEGKDDQCYKEVFLGHGKVTTVKTSFSYRMGYVPQPEAEEGNVFVNFHEYPNGNIYCRTTVRKGMVTAYKDLGKHELDVGVLVEKANRISPEAFITSI